LFPKLRFKEFDGDLTESKLVELTSWASGGTPAKDVPEYWGDGIPLISGASMHTNQLYESDVKITKLGLQKGSKLALKDSILILVRGSMLFNKIPMGITLGDVAFNQDVKCIRPKQQLAPLFLFQWLHAKENTIQNKVTATGIGAGKLDTADLQNLKLYKPSLEEQTKIATFLSAVDEKISQLTQKHQLLREYKQGMMQKLFSQQVRFKADDGSEFGEWDQLKFKDVIKIKYGKDHKKLDDGDIPVLGTGGVMRYVDSYLYEGESILIGRKGTIDKPRFISGKFWTVDTLFYTEIGEKILPKFAFQQLLLVNWLNLNEATGVPSLNTTSIGNIELKVPCLAEQTKIANVLSAIDQKIEVVSKQIEQAKQWKKGLLQQMFI
jgi:type I restriction enzyme S subunit